MVLYNAAGVVDPRMVGSLQQSPVLSGLPGPQLSPSMPANSHHHHNMAGLPQFQLPQAAFVQNPSMIGHPRPFGSLPAYGDPVTVIPGFEGSDLYIANQGVIVGRKEKRYIRIRWGDGQ